MEISLSTLQEKIYQALRDWHKGRLKASPLAHLELFRQVRFEEGSNLRRATNKVLLRGLETLAVDHQTEATLLRERFLDGLAMQVVANQLNISEAQAYRKQKVAIKHLALILRTEEEQARSNYLARLEKRLTLPPEVHLFGISDPFDTLQEVLAQPNPPWLVSIEGLGGLGKTALAAALIRQSTLTSQFYNIAWVSAKQEEFLPSTGLEQTGSPALTVDTLIDNLLEQLEPSLNLTLSPQEKRATLTGLLKKAPYLIVIDNLETVVDYQTLLPVLRELANPGKVLLTSRYSLQAYPDLFCLSLAELDLAKTIELIRHEARVRGLTVLAEAPRRELKRIFEVVGGNPLALKLVIGQVSMLALSQVLDYLKQARGKKIDELFTYIYWQAWHMLDPASQQVLLVMPLAQGGTLDQLLALSQIELDELIQALQQLIGLSLIQVSGSLDERRYTIHRLTETFLLNEAIKWQSSD